MILSVIALIAGILLILLVLQDSFETIVLPRRVTRRFRLASLFYSSTWLLWSFIARKATKPGNRREFFLSYFGPLSLILLLLLWAVILMVGFALIQFGLGSHIRALEKPITFLTDLYLSGTTFITLGMGDVIPMQGWPRFFIVVEAGTGFAFLALIIGYVPVIYQAFSRREAYVSSLDARAGSPPTASEMLRRHCKGDHTEALVEYLERWEQWCTELLESHLSYPVLTYYRSQHERQSWLGALTTILDVCALIMVGVDHVPVKPAKFIFAIARHAAVDLAQAYNVAPTMKTNRLSTSDFEKMRARLASTGVILNCPSGQYEQKLKQIRGTYEPFVDALAQHLLFTLPSWYVLEDPVDDWQTSAWDHFLESTPRTVDRAIRSE